MLRARALVRRHHEGGVLQRAAPVHHRPPVHRRGRAPRVHVRGDADQHLRALKRQFADRFGEQPVVADRAPEHADLGVRDRERVLRVAGDVVRAGVDLPRQPRVNLPVLVQQSLRADQARRVEHAAGIFRIHFQEAAGLHVDAQVAGLLVVARGVLVRDRHREPVGQFRDRLVDRGRVPELREHDEFHVAERPVADHGAVDHAEHVPDAVRDGPAVGRVGEVGLAGGGQVAKHVGTLPSGSR